MQLTGLECAAPEVEAACRGIRFRLESCETWSRHPKGRERHRAHPTQTYRAKKGTSPRLHLKKASGSAVWKAVLMHHKKACLRTKALRQLCIAPMTGSPAQTAAICVPPNTLQHIYPEGTLPEPSCLCRFHRAHGPD